VKSGLQNEILPGLLSLKKQEKCNYISFSGLARPLFLFLGQPFFRTPPSVTIRYVFGLLWLKPRWYAGAFVFDEGVIAIEEEKDLLLERNVLRDRQMFKIIKKQDVNEGNINIRQETDVTDFKSNKLETAIAWKWQKDPNKKRDFLIPVGLGLEKYFVLTDMHFARDVLAAITTLYCHNKPKNRTITTTFLEICNYMGVSANGKTYEGISNSLTFLRAYTIRKHSVPLEKVKRGVKMGDIDFGFIDYSAVSTEIITPSGDIEPIPVSQRSVKIVFSSCYADLLENSAVHIIPFAAISAARNLPRRHIVPAKNIVYNLSARSGKKARLKEATLIDIAGLRPERPSRGRKAINRILNNMQKLGIISFAVEANKDNQAIYSVQLITEKRATNSETTF
jgi:hypothetical protein